MEERCIRHQFEPVADFCRNCGDGYCPECLVYSFGRNEQPYCVSCALAAAGVRSNAARPATKSRKEIRRQAKERKKAEKQAKETAKVEVKPVEIDWSIPPDAEQGEEATDTGLDWLDDQLPSGDRVSF
jgi:hypothetical protein